MMPKYHPLHRTTPAPSSITRKPKEEVWKEASPPADPRCQTQEGRGGSGIHRTRRQSLLPYDPFLFQFCWLGQGPPPSTPHTAWEAGLASSTRQSGDPESYRNVKGRIFTPFQLHSQ